MRHTIRLQSRGSARLQTLADFSLLPTLPLLYVPFLFVLSVYVNYDKTFRKLPSTIVDPVSFYAKRRAIVGAGGRPPHRLRRLEAWSWRGGRLLGGTAAAAAIRHLRPPLPLVLDAAVGTAGWYASASVPDVVRFRIRSSRPGPPAIARPF